MEFKVLITFQKFADGLTNVCYNALGPLSENMFLYAPILISCGIILFLIVKYWTLRDLPLKYSQQNPSSFANQQAVQPLMESAIEQGSVCSSMMEDGVPMDLSYYAIPHCWRLCIAACLMVSVASIVALHITYRFDSTSENLAIGESVR